MEYTLLKLSNLTWDKTRTTTKQCLDSTLYTIKNSLFEPYEFRSIFDGFDNFEIKVLRYYI